jgi:hypothetical protein
VTAVVVFSLFCTELEGTGTGTQGPKLVNATAVFVTTDDDKDHDTSVSILVRRDNGEIVARLDDVTGYFANGSTKTFPIKIVPSAPSRGQVLNGTTTVVISPNGHDTWRFDYTLKLEFHGNPPVDKEYKAVVLNEAAKERTFPLYSK